jgi:protein-S-isoprenylcysteine O-methyltransferase Ste14
MFCHGSRVICLPTARVVQGEYLCGPSAPFISGAKITLLGKFVMKRASAIFGSAIFLVVAPGTLAIYLPWAVTRWHFASPLLGLFLFRILGVVMIAAGLPILLDSFARFAIQGLGTPAPIAPPQRLIVTGLYRWVRNPMYVAVSLLIFGQGFLFGSLRLLQYGLLIWLAFFAFVVFYEEPALSRKFGNEYEEFCAQVPRWIPRLKPLEPRP